MKVTPVKKKFGKYSPGESFDLPDKAAKVLIKVGKLRAVDEGSQVYRTRVMQPQEPMQMQQAAMQAEAPWGYKTDGTPRKRPGRPATE